MNAGAETNWASVGRRYIVNCTTQVSTIVGGRSATRAQTNFFMHVGGREGVWKLMILQFARLQILALDRNIVQ